MTETEMLMVFLAVLQPAMLGLLTFAAFRELRALDRAPRARERRSANPSIRAGLAMIGFGCFGRFALSMRALIVRLLGYSGKSLFALMNLPEPVVELANTVSTMVAIIGILMLIRGLRAVLFREAEGTISWASGGLKVLSLILLLGLLVLDWRLGP